MASKKSSPKKSATKSAAKKVSAKSSKRSNVVRLPRKKMITVVSASDRNEARRALVAHFKINGIGVQERNALRREQRDSFKNY